MAWFTFGKNDDKVSIQAPLESVDAMRQRAKHRLIGSVVLVLIGIVGFPLLYDRQPRPILVDTPIVIPDKTKTTPLAAPAEPVLPASGAKVDNAASLNSLEAIISSSAKPAVKLEEKQAVAQEGIAQTATKTIATGAAVVAAGAVATGVAATAAKDAAARDKVAADKAMADKAATAEADKARAQKAQMQAQADAETARAKALLEGKTPQAKPIAAAAAETGRFIVQFGAFGDANKAREARQKVEKAGLKTYSQVAKTADGERIRVRVGPFATKAEADKAASKIKTLGLPAAVLTL